MLPIPPQKKTEIAVRPVYKIHVHQTLHLRGVLRSKIEQLENSISHGLPTAFLQE